MMRPALPFAPVLAISAALLAAVCPAPLVAAPGGQLGTLPRGPYVCELPGDATGAVGIAQPAFDFTVTNASTYRTASGKGIYLLTGDRLTFTSGPHDGLTYRRIYSGFLRRTGADGRDSTLRCIKGSRRTATGTIRPDPRLAPIPPEALAGTPPGP